MHNALSKTDQKLPKGNSVPLFCEGHIKVTIIERSWRKGTLRTDHQLMRPFRVDAFILGTRSKFPGITRVVTITLVDFTTGY